VDAEQERIAVENTLQAPSANLTSRWRKFYRNYSRTLVPFIIAAILIIAGEFVSPGFAGPKHIIMLLKVSALLGVLVLAQSIVIIAGGEGIDLSVGAIASITAVMSSVIINGKDENLLPALVAVLIVGFFLGLINGVGIAVFNVPPLIMTLGMASVINGMVIIYSQGFIIRGSASDLLKTIGGGQTIPGLPNVILVWIVLIAISLYVLNRTKSGMMLYGVGANEITAELTGVRARRVRALAYAVSGAISGLGGMLLLGYNGLPYIDMGSIYVMPSVAAAVIGGISLAGGSGSYLGAAGGAILLTTLSALLVTMRMGEGGKQMVFGLVLIILLAIYGRRPSR
jgi:ribose transport system permease protein